MDYSEFSSAEKFIQEISGEEEYARSNARLISGKIVPQLFDFINSRNYFFAATQDSSGCIWASVLAGEPGFIEVEGPQELKINPGLLSSAGNDYFWKNIEHKSGIGLLFINLVTRFRFRVNGTVKPTSCGWKLTVKQAFPNCPKYIQRRRLFHGEDRGRSMGQDLKKWISFADTFFVGSANTQGDLDVSHKGGKPGFIKWAATDVLRIPDYFGNSMFMTLGNIYENPIAGILFIDFSNGETVQLTGKVAMHINESGEEGFSGNTNRFWDYQIKDVRFNHSLPNFSSSFIDYSPYNPVG